MEIPFPPTVEYYIEDAKELCLAAYHSDNADWETVVGREVIIGTNVSVPLEEIIAVFCLALPRFGISAILPLPYQTQTGICQ